VTVVGVLKKRTGSNEENSENNVREKDIMQVLVEGGQEDDAEARLLGLQGDSAARALSRYLCRHKMSASHLDGRQ
jgi:hypothetical protein